MHYNLGYVTTEANQAVRGWAVRINRTQGQVYMLSGEGKVGQIKGILNS